MDRNVRLLGVGAGVRTLGMALFGPYLALFFHYDLGLSYVEVALVLVGLGITPIPISVLGGLLADRWGRRRIFLSTLTGEAVCVGLLGYAMLRVSLPMALAVAFAASIVSTLGGPALSAYVADLSAGADRRKGFTWYRVGNNAGFSAGVALGGFLVPYLGFGRTTLLSAVILLVGVSFLSLVLRPSAYDLALKARAAQERAGAAPGASAAPLPGRSARRPSIPQSLRTVAHDRVFLGFCLAAALAELTIGQWNNTLVLFADGPMRIPFQWLGVGLALNGAVVVFGQQLTTHATLGRRMTTIMIGGLALYVVAFLAFGIAALFVLLPVVVWLVGVVVLTLGENLTSIPFSTLPSNMAPKEELGFYNGGFSSILTIGGLLSTFLGGLALQEIANPLLLWALLVAPSLPAVLLLRRSARTMRPELDRS